MIATWRRRARQLKVELHALMLAYRDSRTPWYARLWTAVVVAYALSPIDLIPDPIPVLGYLDDLVLLPLGIWIALKMIPAAVMVEARERAQSGDPDASPNWIAAVVIVLIWVAGVIAVLACIT